MKITIEIPDRLHKEAKTLAAREGTTLRTLVEHGLRRELEQRSQLTSFRLRKASFKGKGLQTGAEGLRIGAAKDLADRR